MNDNDRENNDDSWDFERAERRSSTRPARAVVSVAFNRDDFDQVSATAQAFHMKVSEFIRTAALAAAGRQFLIHLGTELTFSQARWSYVSAEEATEPSTASEGRYPLERVTP